MEGVGGGGISPDKRLKVNCSLTDVLRFVIHIVIKLSRQL